MSDPSDANISGKTPPAAAAAAPAKEVDVYDMRPTAPTTAGKSGAEDAQFAKFSNAVGDLQPLAATIMPNLRTQRPPPLLIESHHYDGVPPNDWVRGYAVKVSGDTRLGTPSARLAVAHHETGSGTSLYPIQGTHSVADMERRMREAQAAGKLPALPAYGESAHIGVYRQTSATAVDDTYYVAVRANDTPAAVHLMEKTALAAKAGTPLTIKSLAHSIEYTDLVKSSQCVRDQLANETADALGVQLTQRSASQTSLSDSVVQANCAAHSAGAGGSGGDDETPQQYVVYNDATNADESHHGAIVSHGLLGGLTHVQTSATRTRADGSQSAAWVTDYLSAVPTTTGAYNPTVHSKAALHIAASAEAAAAFKRKVHWQGDMKAAHHRQTEAYAAQDDPSVVAWMHKNVRPKDGTPLRTADLHFVAGVLPDTATLGMTTEQLATVAASGEMRSMPVLMRSDTVQALVRHYDDIVKALPDAARAKITPGTVFGATAKETVDPVFTVRSACHGGADGPNDPAHWHAWHSERSLDETTTAVLIVDQQKPGSMQQQPQQQQQQLPYGWIAQRTHERIRGEGAAGGGGGGAAGQHKYTVLYLDSALAPLILAQIAAEKQLAESAPTQQ